MFQKRWETNRGSTDSAMKPPLPAADTRNRDSVSGGGVQWTSNSTIVAKVEGPVLTGAQALLDAAATGAGIVPVVVHLARLLDVVAGEHDGAQVSVHLSVEFS